MFAPNGEKDPNYEAVNKHLSEQPAIKLLTEKVQNLCKYMLTQIAEHKLDCLGEASVKSVGDRFTKLHDTIGTEPVPFIQAISMLGQQFFDLKTRKFDFQKLTIMLPTIRKMASTLPGTDPGLLSVELEKLPTEILEKTKAYIDCFCNIIMPK